MIKKDIQKINKILSSARKSRHQLLKSFHEKILCWAPQQLRNNTARPQKESLAQQFSTISQWSFSRRLNKTCFSGLKVLMLKNLDLLKQKINVLKSQMCVIYFYIKNNFPSKLPYKNHLIAIFLILLIACSIFNVSIVTKKKCYAMFEDFRKKILKKI